MNFKRGFQRAGIAFSIVWIVGFTAIFSFSSWAPVYLPSAWRSHHEVKTVSGEIIETVPADLSKSEFKSIVQEKGYGFLVDERCSHLKLMYDTDSESVTLEEKRVLAKCRLAQIKLAPSGRELDWYIDFGPHEPTLEDIKRQLLARVRTIFLPVVILWALFFCAAWILSGFKSDDPQREDEP